TLPCADCAGIDYQLNLRPDHTFASRMVYEGRNASFGDSGSWGMDGAMLVLKGKHGGTERYAIRDADTLRQLDANGNAIQSKLNYDLKRAPSFMPLQSGGAVSPKLEGTEWKLIQIGTTPVHAGPKEAYILLDSASHRVSGSGGCNRLVGSYEITGNQLKFGQMAGTRMACAEGMGTEQALLQALGDVSAWKIASGKLELFDSGSKLLATFGAHRN
ncbi:MAG: META domain-containing protein, partial [Terracidiphilus sp.]